MRDKTTTPIEHWPLNESQRRSLAIVLAGIEQDLHRVAETAQRPPRPSRLTRYIEPLPAGNGDALAEPLRPIHEHLRQLADDLQLPPHEDSITRSLTAVLMLDEMAVLEVEPSRLRGYGVVDAATAAYLNRELPRLRALLATLTEALATPRADSHPRP